MVVSRSLGKRKYTRYTQQEREEFLALLDRVGSVAGAAAQLGINRTVCHKWAREAGVQLKRGGRFHPGREEFFRLRKSGVRVPVAARKVGVNLRTAWDWDNGVVRLTGGGRMHPDGRVIDYKRGVTTMNTAAAAAMVPALQALEKPIDPRYLSLPDRERIQDLLQTGASMRAIAAILGRPASTVSREIARNKAANGIYRPYAAHRAAAARRPRPKASKLTVSARLRKEVQAGLKKRWSPEQISHRLIKDYPDDQEMRVSPETIYQALYLQARGGLRREVTAALRTGRARRKTQNTGEERRPRFSDPMVMISERPPEIEDRAVPGHWEGDLIIGANTQSAIATLVERTTRYVMLVHLPGSHNAEDVRDGLLATIATLPEHLRGSLTWDQGSEMAAHKSFTMATNMPVYFCDPGSPWQRGSNENTNGLLRQYFPKGTDLSAYGYADLEHVAQELNGRPRKTLNWDNPAERMRDLIMNT